MNTDVGLMMVVIFAVFLGVWYFFAGLNGWKYPRIKGEYDNDNEKIIFRILKIIVGVGRIVCTGGGIIDILT